MKTETTQGPLGLTDLNNFAAATRMVKAFGVTAEQAASAFAAASTIATMRVACILEQANHEPGDQAPEGYLAWHEWADTQHKAGLRQKECGRCSKWKYPQELSATIDECVMQSRKGPVTLMTPVCHKCAANNAST